MHIEYLDADLRRAVMAPQGRVAGWSEVETLRLRQVVQCVMAAKVADDLFNMRLLRLRRDPDDDDVATTALSAQRLITLAFKANTSPVTAVLDSTSVRTEGP